MSLIAERIQKAIKRRGSLNLGSIREEARQKQPIEMASPQALRERRSFLLQTSENAESATVAYERIIHGNELQDVNYLVRGMRAARAIGRISIREPNGRLAGYGTGFLIGERLLLTNNHVLRGAMWAERSEVEFEYERDEAGRQLPGIKFPLKPGELFFTHEALDFSVVAVAPRAVNAERDVADFGFLPLIGGTGKAVEGEWLTIVQHPGGELKQLCVRENRLLEKGPDVLWYSTDTLGGSSGAPVFNNDWMVVALHHSGVPEIKNGRWQTIDGQDYDESSHREEDIKWVANEGIRVSRIVQTLEAALGDHPLIRAALTVKVSETTTQPQPAPAAPVTAMNPPTSLPPSATRKYILSIDGAGNPSIVPFSGTGTTESAWLALEKAQSKAKAKTKPRGISFKFDDDYSTRKGFDVNFLNGPGDNGKYRVHLPQMTPALAAAALPLLEPAGTKNCVLDYTNMSIVMHAKRKFAIYSAANVDMAIRYKLESKRVWRYDPRIPLDAQIGDDAYAGNQFDKGHLTRQEDMEFGDSMEAALQSTADTCHWTNCILQHQKFNRTKGWWQGMEQHILEYAVDFNNGKGKGFPAQVFTGPIFGRRDPEFDELPDIKVPMKFWKVCAAVTSSGKLFAVAYLLDQTPVIAKYGVAEAAGETPFEPYRAFQLPIAELEGMIQLKFTYGPNKKPLSNCDPLKDGTPPELDADQDGDDDRLESVGVSTRGAAKGWVNLENHRPYFG